METQTKNHPAGTAGEPGRLKLFFGYATGVGKTAAMLKAARAARDRGEDVVIGCIDPHVRPEVRALAEGIEALEPGSGDSPTDNSFSQEAEFPLDAAIRRKPALLIIDECAHQNPPGARHAKRYQDINELLAAGIDVYTTINVHEIESLVDTVTDITGLAVKDRIPDRFFDGADQVELVDIEPADLLDRLRAGHVAFGGSPDTADRLYTVEKLTALREIALRRSADRMNLLSEPLRVQNHGGYHTDEHILVCLSPAPSNQKIIRTAARMAHAFRGLFTALFVETPGFSALEPEDRDRLRANMRLAEQLGAKIETVCGEDISYQIAEFTRLSGVSKIVIGRTGAARKYPWSKPALTERLIAIAPNVDIYIIPDNTDRTAYRAREQKAARRASFSVKELIETLGILTAATLIGCLFRWLGFTEPNIITVYLLAVLVISVVTRHRLWSFLASVISVLVFNFFFTEPHFSFEAYDRGYPVTFLIMFLASLITGSLAVRLKNHAKQSAQAAFRTKVLFETNQYLQKATDREAIFTVTAQQLIKLLGRNIVIYPCGEDRLESPHAFPASGKDEPLFCLNEKEKSVALWVYANNKRAGATTDTLSDARCLYLAIRLNRHVYGVVGIEIGNEPLDAFENSVLMSILGESALALENESNARGREEAAILAKNEQLRANLLRAISHDLRTPLTSISGNADNLLSNGDRFDDAAKTQIYTDIYDDAIWLMNLVENLLAVTRIEDGRMKLRLSAELTDEVITESLHHINRKSVEHTITVTASDEFILAKMDAKLIVQVIINIVNNAIKYTPAGSTITIDTQKDGDMVAISIADDGPGISDEAKKHVFEMFYSGANKIADSRRSLGMGLSLCKSIVNAHGGEITVGDNHPHGTVFRFTLPAEEIPIQEPMRESLGNTNP